MTTPAPNEAAHELPTAVSALRSLTEALLTHADNDYLRRQITAAVHILSAHGCTMPVPWPDADFGVERWSSRAARALTQGEPAGWLTVCGPTAGCGVQYAGNLASCPNCGKVNFARPAGTTVTLAGAQAPGAMKWQEALQFARKHIEFMRSCETSARAIELNSEALAVIDAALPATPGADQ